jgi:hypothetical protein
LNPGGTRLALVEKRRGGTGVLGVEAPCGKEVVRCSGLSGMEEMVFRSGNGLLVIFSPSFASSLLARDVLFT